MHSLLSLRLRHIFMILLLNTALAGCGEGDGPARILNEPAAPFAGPPDSCFEALTFEDVCDQAFDFTNFEGGVAQVVENPVQDDNNPSAKVVQMEKFRATSGLAFGGSTMTFSPPLPQVNVPAGSFFTIKVWSQRPVSVLFQPEPAGPGTGVEVSHGGTGWEELTFDFGSFSGNVTAWTFIFDNGTLGDTGGDPDNWTFYFDDISTPQGGSGGGGGGGAAALPVDFEADPASYDFGADGGFGGGASDVIANPDASGTNTSAQTARMQKFAGEVFGGSTLNLGADVDFSAGEVFIMKVWSTRVVPILFKFEGLDQERSVDHGGSGGWEELCFDFTGSTAGPSSSAITFIFDLGVNGDAEGDPDNWTFYYDDIQQVASCPTGGGGGGGGASASTDFEGDPASYAFNDFEGGAASVIANPDVSGINTSAQVGQMQKFAGATFGGSTLDLGGAVELAPGDSYTIKVRASRPVVVTLKLEPLDQETTASHSGSGTWEELCFDFTGVSGSVTGLTLIFDNGTAGDAENDPDNWTFQFDDIQQASSCATGGGGGVSLGPIDFEPNGLGGAFAWTVFENGDNPPLEVIANPDATGANTSATVAQFTARQAGQPFAGIATSDLPTFTLDASNAIVKILVWKTVISDVGIKFETASQASSGEIKVANTVTSQWEELTFDFSGKIGEPTSTDITGLVVFPDFNARTQDNVVYFDDVSFSAIGGGGGGGTATAVDFEDAGGPYTFGDFGGGAAQVIDNPDASGLNTSAKVGQMEKFAGEVFGGSTLTLPAEIDFSAGEVFTMKVWAAREVPVLFKLEGLLVERSVNQSGGSSWEELCFDFTGSTSGPASSAITLIFDLGVNGAAETDPTNWTFYFDDIQQAVSCPTGGGGGGGASAAVDFETDNTGAGFTWNVFENGDNPPLAVIANPDASGANTSATVAEFTARQAGQPFAGTVTSDLPTFTLDGSNQIVRIKVWKTVISDVGIKFETGSGASTGEIKVPNSVTSQWEELTFDFSGKIGEPSSTDITGLVVFPDFNARTQDNVIYFDDISFSAN